MGPDIHLCAASQRSNGSAEIHDHYGASSAIVAHSREVEQLNRMGTTRFTRKLTPAAHCGSATTPEWRCTPWTSSYIGNQWSRLRYTVVNSPFNFASRHDGFQRAVTWRKKGKINITPASCHRDKDVDEIRGKWNFRPRYRRCVVHITVKFAELHRRQESCVSGRNPRASHWLSSQRSRRASYDDRHAENVTLYNKSTLCISIWRACI